MEKKDQGKVINGLKMIVKNKNLLCAMFYSFFNMFGILGRISVAVFFYIHCVQNFTLITVFMMMQMAVGTLVMPFAPKYVEKFGKRNGAIISMIIQGGALILLYFGPSTNIPFNFLCMVIYGVGYLAGSSGSGMIVDAIDDFDDKYGVRNDGMAFSFNGTAIKIATAIANSVLSESFRLLCMSWINQDIWRQSENALPRAMQRKNRQNKNRLGNIWNVVSNLKPALILLCGWNAG